jgi:tetratricopeptide (TPR) repeat protein/DNA-directed RNA polymerase subunit RPC12/RpoP
VDISFNCERCGQHIEIDEAGSGMLVQCPTCGHSVQVPARSVASEARPADTKSTKDDNKQSSSPVHPVTNLQPLNQSHGVRGNRRLIAIGVLSLLVLGAAFTVWRFHSKRGASSEVQDAIKREIQSARKQQNPEQAANALYVAAAKDLSEAQESEPGLKRTLAICGAVRRYKTIVDEFPSSSVAVDIVKSGGVEVFGEKLPLASFEDYGDLTMQIIDHAKSRDAFLRFLAGNPKKCPQTAFQWAIMHKDWDALARLADSEEFGRLWIVEALYENGQQKRAQQLIAVGKPEEQERFAKFVGESANKGETSGDAKPKSDPAKSQKTSPSWLVYWRSSEDIMSNLKSGMRSTFTIHDDDTPASEAFVSVVKDGDFFRALNMVSRLPNLYENDAKAFVAVAMCDRGRKEEAVRLIDEAVAGLQEWTFKELSEYHTLPYVRAYLYAGQRGKASALAEKILDSSPRESAVSALLESEVAAALAQKDLDLIVKIITDTQYLRAYSRDGLLDDAVASYLDLDQPENAKSLVRLMSEGYSRQASELRLAAYFMSKGDMTSALDALARASHGKSFVRTSDELGWRLIADMQPNEHR